LHEFTEIALVVVLLIGVLIAANDFNYEVVHKFAGDLVPDW
jgi:hypothetical protein